MATNKIISAVIAGAGESVRFQRQPKQFVLLDGKPLLYYSLKKLALLEGLSEIIVVTSDIEATKILLQEFNFLSKLKIKVVAGGKLRQHSVFNGFSNVSKSSELVLIHDVARPLFDLSDVKKCIEKAAIFESCVLGIPVIDTIKETKFHNDELIVSKTIDRKDLYIIQTPQVFTYDLLSGAYKMYKDSEDVFTDEAQMIEKSGKEVYLVIGTRRNIKITYTEDLEIASKMLKEDCNYSGISL